MSILSQLGKLLNKKTKIIVILGQTSTGKSDLAVEIARQISAEIISADSRQVYRGLDLGSGKITKDEMKDVPHHLLDVSDPMDSFSVQEYIEHGRKVIAEISSRNKNIIICGGTGYYIDSLLTTNNLPKVPANKKLRDDLERMTTIALAEKLHKKSKSDAQRIDLNNRPRIIRALEILEVHNKIPKQKKTSDYNVLYIGLKMEKEELYSKIKKRIDSRMQAGILNEVSSLLSKKKITHERLEELGLEYRYAGQHLSGIISHEKMLDLLFTKTKQFTKRQMTWFKRNRKIVWLHPQKNIDEIHSICRKFLK